MKRRHSVTVFGREYGGRFALAAMYGFLRRVDRWSAEYDAEFLDWLTRLRERRIRNLLDGALGRIAVSGFRRAKKLYKPNGQREVERRRDQTYQSKNAGKGERVWRQDLRASGFVMRGASLRPDNCGNIPTLAQRRLLAAREVA